ncbi:MAG: START-like domain-containing protein [Bacteroidota bacterium]|nr:START-like domain-containing protein [Bacteroidota bacterium]
MTKKMKRVEINLEFPIRCSPSILFNYISNPSGLQEWFAHKVISKSRLDFEFEFDDGTINKAKLLKSVNNRLTRFKWENSPENEFMEIEIIVDELTDDVAIKITEQCSEEEMRGLKELWESQIDTLRHVVGS